MKKFTLRRRMLRGLIKATLTASVIGPLAVQAAGVPTLDTVEVEAGAEELVGTADTSSVGTVDREQLQSRPILRAGELLEEVPGLIVTQHSNEGKANQYFLRGFNLDHGTDLRIEFNGALVNQRSHGHGQGWADLNFVIPELVTALQYRKGPYFADKGDFASAGSVDLDYLNILPEGIASVGIGENGFKRLFTANSSQAGAGNLLYGFEAFRYDGPWVNEEDFRRYNGVLRYSQGDAQNGFSVSALAYDSDGNATNQIAQRAVDNGFIDRLGSLDPTDGNETSRYSLSGDWRRTLGNTLTKANIYVIRHELNLWSNFTYFLEDPVNGDQFQQTDDRVTSGGAVDHTWFTNWGGREVENSVGLQLQNDNIFNNLLRTRARERLSTVREDHIVESSAGLYFQNRTQWHEKFRTVAGLRGDIFRFDVDSDNDANSGTETDSIANPKLSLIFGPWAETEYYVSAGGGFHSNDARGTTISLDPANTDDLGANLSAEVVPGLVRSKGYEVGVRTGFLPGLQSSFSIYALDFDSELVFLGDAGTTEAGRASRRIGFEFANYYKPTNWLTIDADIAYARARFEDDAFDETGGTIGDRIPGAVEGVATLGASVDNLGPWFGSVQARYFGPRPLLEDNSVRSDSTTLVGARVGYKINKDLRLSLEGFNLFDSQDNTIDYYYESRLQEELGTVGDEGVPDFHFHPVEPRAFRLFVELDF